MPTWSAPAALLRSHRDGRLQERTHLLLTSPKIDRRRSRMESPIEVVRRFCAAWSDNFGPVELVAFFTDDAVYHNIPFAPVAGREAIATNIASFIRPGPPGIKR